MWLPPPLSPDLPRPPPLCEQQTPHILIFWRPDLRRYSAFLTTIAPPDAKPDPTVSMTLLPDLTKNNPMAMPFKEWQVGAAP